jgi:fimbrial chaperone protein
MYHIKKMALSGLFALACIAFQGANASVVMTGTRIIYPAQAQEKVVQLSNRDEYPYLVQMWIDSGNSDETPQSASAPFVISPQIFRMNPDAGQIVRLVFTGEGLAKDRESLFYLNFVQVPAMKARDLEANKLLLSVNSRMKLFYRPQGLAGDPDDLSKSLGLKMRGSALLVSNSSGYFATVRSAEVVRRGVSKALVQAVIIPPLGQVDWPLPAGVQAGVGDKLRLTLVNDFGADVTTELPIN